MKKSRIARKCSQKSGLTIAQFVNGFRSSQPCQLVVELEDVKPEVMTFKAFQPIQVSSIGRTVPKASKYFPTTPRFLEVKALTKKEAKAMRRQGYKLQLLGAVSSFDCSASIIRAVKGATVVTGTGKIALFDSVARKGRVSRRGGGGHRCQAGGGGGGGHYGGDGLGGGLGFGGGGGGFGPYSPATERRFLYVVLKVIEEQEKKLDEQKAILEDQASKVRQRIRELPEEEEGGLDEPEKLFKKRVFHADVDNGHMANALYLVYEHYKKNNKFNNEFKIIDLIAYLFVMVDILGYGRHDFHVNGKKPFFDFFVSMAVPELEKKDGIGTRGITRESMRNRINDKLFCLYPNSTPKSQLPTGEKMRVKQVENEFCDICGNFHKTKYGAILKKHFGK